MNDIITRKMRLPDGCDGLVIEDPAGDYNVYISDQLSPYGEEKVKAHELEHIRRGHLHSDMPAEDCEKEANGI